MLTIDVGCQKLRSFWRLLWQREKYWKRFVGKQYQDYLLFSCPLSLFASQASGSDGNFSAPVFVIPQGGLATIPAAHLEFLEGADETVGFEFLEKAEWAPKLVADQSLVEVIGSVCGSRTRSRRMTLGSSIISTRKSGYLPGTATALMNIPTGQEAETAGSMKAESMPIILLRCRRVKSPRSIISFAANPLTDIAARSMGLIG